MKIDKLFIYGYGHLQNKQIELGQSLHVFYGENEAGKSTILSFIETMLFGFPRRQSNELRYEPKTGGVHGGKIELRLERAGIVTIERVRGREPDESIVTHNDKLITEQKLSELLQGIDRLLFQDIFSARLEHLRAMEKLDEVDLNRFLLGAGISGNLSLVDLETTLANQQGELFKPQGRLPLMNKQLQQLKKLESLVHKSEGLREQYEHKNTKQQAIEAKLNTMADKKEALKTKRYFYEKVKALEPMYEEKQLQQLKLAELPDVQQFPEDGIARYERLQTRLLDFTGEVESVQKKIKQLHKERPVVNDAILEQQVVIQQKRERAESYRLKQERLLLLSEQMKHENALVTELMDELGTGWTAEKLHEADVSFTEQEKLETLTDAVNNVQEQHTYLEKDLSATRNRFKASELKEKESERLILAPEVREQLQAEVAESEQENSEQAEQFIHKMVAQLERQIEHVGKPMSQGIVYMFMLLAVLTASSFLFLRLPYIAIVSVVLFTVLFMFTRTKRQKKLDTLSELTELKKEEEKQLLLIQKAEEMTHEDDIAEAKQNLLEDDEQRKQWQMAKHFREQAEHDYETLSRRYDKMEKTLQKKRANLREWTVKHGYPTSMTSDQLLRAFTQIQTAKKSVRAITEAEKEMTGLKQWVANYEQNIYDLATIFDLAVTGNASQLLLQIEAKLENEREKRRQISHIEAQLAEETERMDASRAKKAQYEQAIAELFGIAKCETEEAYFEKGKAWLEKEKLQERMTLINHQIDIQLPHTAEREKVAPILETKTEESDAIIQQLTNELNDIEEEEGALFKQVAEIRVDLQNLERGGDYDKYLQEFEMERSAFRDNAKEWAIYTTALDLLEKTKEQHRDERLPKVVERATAYFEMITEGRYTKIHVPIEGDKFSVISGEGVRYSPQELSRGTQEQLYLSLRLALTVVYPAGIRYPILLDDLLVHFDYGRMEAALKVLHEHARTHQVLFFTCHQHIANEFAHDQVLQLSRYTYA